MKKLISILISLVSVIGIAFAFVGCGEQAEEDKPEGELYRLGYALERGWIDEFDLKSIACGYYEWLNIEENPYSGLFEEPTDELSEETQNKIKMAYFGKIEGITIPKYYGNYDGNIVVTLGFEDRNYDGVEGKDVSCYDVVFPKFDLYPIRVYHYPERKDPATKVNGNMYGIKQAYENGYLDESSLKSISCFYYDLYEYEENPYNGLYEKPTQKLSREIKKEIKQAYLNQIVKEPDGYFDEVVINRYYGIYNGNIVISVSGYEGCAFPDSEAVDKIGGVTFVRDCCSGIYVYKLP